MIKKIVCASVGMAVWAAIAVEGGRPQTELLASVEFASFSAFQQKVADLGATINNPVVSMMAVPAVQNALTERFGRFRQDETIMLLCYADMTAMRKAMAADVGDAGDALDAVLLYPSAEGPKEFIDSHPEAQKKPDGTIELEDGIVALYAPDGRTCAFASNADAAKRALASASLSKTAAHPLLRLDVTGVGLDLMADFHQKMIEQQAKEMQENMLAETNQASAIVASCLKLQKTASQRQNAKIRSYARLTMSMDLDETGFVFKAEATAKPGAPVSPAAGFKLPAGALDSVPAGAPLFMAANTWLSGSIQSEQDYRAVVDDLCGALSAVSTCARDKPNCKCAGTAKELCTVGIDLLKSAPVPAPTDWGVFGLAFGPQQEPYLIGNSVCAQAQQAFEVNGRFCAALAATVEKSWPGILRAKGASLTVNWFRLVDALAAAKKPTEKDRQGADEVKKAISAIVGGPESEMSSFLASQTAIRFVAGARGFTPPEAAPSGEKRFAAALPEAVAARPSGAFYLSLYSLLRDNALPIAMKVLPQKEKDDMQSILSVLPPAAANGAFVGASWEEKGGSRWIFRVTKDEIRNIGMAANAIMAAQSQSAN